jgi:hypothetical protein
MAGSHVIEPGNPDGLDPFDDPWNHKPAAPRAAMKSPPPVASSPPAAKAPPAASKPVKAPRPITLQPQPKPVRSIAGDLSDLLPADGEQTANSNEVLQEVAQNAPPWLISMIFHMSIVILLGIWVTVTHKAEDFDDVKTEMFAEKIGEQLEDPSVLVGAQSTTPDQVPTEPVITPQDLPEVDDPFAAPPQLSDLSPLTPGPGGVATSDISAPTIGLALSGREAGRKRTLLGAYGGTRTTESSVIAGLKWLVKQQKREGNWSLAGPYPDGAPLDNVPAATAMALLAFQGQGNTHRSGMFKDEVTRGWKYLLKLQEKDGNFSTKGPAQQRLYAHAQCTIALCELYGMTQDSFYRRPAEMAIKYAVKAQDQQGGGWRYFPGEDSDTSVTGWFVMALQSARMAKLEVPAETLENVSRFLDSVQFDDGKQYNYTKGRDDGTAAVSAEGLLCRQYLGWKQNDPRLVDGVAALNRMPIVYEGQRDVYYWYYATQACHHMEGKIWDDWNKVMRQVIPENQVKKGAEEGSWDPNGDKWGSYGGRLYVTCLSIYMLEVYYRHLPIYSGYKYMAGQ